MKKKFVNLYGMQGVGATVVEAKVNARNKIINALSYSYTPRLFRAGDHEIVVWQTPFGVCSSLVEANGQLRATALHGDGVTFDQACDSARYQLAMISCDINKDEIPAILPEKKRSEFLSWVGFQRAYQHAPADTDKHQWAYNHKNEFVPKLKLTL